MRREEGSLIARALSDVVDGPVSGDLSDDPNATLLDAAHDLFCRQGIQRTTMDDVARVAGVSRITVYRRMVSKEALVEQVVLREFRRYFDQFLRDVRRAETVEDRVVVGFVGSLRAIRGNPLIAAVLTSEPQYLAPSVLGEDGHTLAVVREFLAGQLRREQQAGEVDTDVDVELAAELMARLCTSFLLIPSDVVDVDDDEQLARVARDYLVPMLNPRSAARARSGARARR